MQQWNFYLILDILEWQWWRCVTHVACSVFFSKLNLWDSARHTYMKNSKICHFISHNWQCKLQWLNPSYSQGLSNKNYLYLHFSTRLEVFQMHSDLAKQVHLRKDAEITPISELIEMQEISRVELLVNIFKMLYLLGTQF